MENILLIRLKSIGDVLFTLPAVNVVRQHFPQANITFLTSRENAVLVQGFRAVNQILAIDRAGLSTGNPRKIVQELIPLLWRLRVANFSLVADFQGYGETEWLAWWSGAAERMGIVYKAGRGGLYTAVSGHHEQAHPAEWNLALLRAAGLDSNSIRNEFILPEGDLARARDFFAAHHLEEHKTTLFLQPFTSNPAKNWSLAHFLELARRVRSLGWQIVFGGGPADQAALEPARAAGFVVAAGVPLMLSAGLVKLSSVVVGGDTGLMHLAVAMQKRVVMIMRTNEPGSCHPYQHPEWTVTPLAGQTVAEIAPDRVLEAVRDKLTPPVGSAFC